MSKNFHFHSLCAPEQNNNMKQKRNDKIWKMKWFASPTYTYTSLSKWSKETMYELSLACPNDMYYELNVHVLCGYLSTAGEHICTRFEGVLAACANGSDHRCRPIIVKISTLYICTYTLYICTYTLYIHMLSHSTYSKWIAIYTYV